MEDYKEQSIKLYSVTYGDTMCHSHSANAYFNNLIPSNQIFCSLCNQACNLSSHLLISCTLNYYFCYSCLMKYLKENNNKCPIIYHQHKIKLSYILDTEDNTSITACDYEGCKWFGLNTHLLYHKEYECNFSIEYLRQRCKNLQLTINLMSQTVYTNPQSQVQVYQYQNQWYHPGFLSDDEKSKIHSGVKIFENTKKKVWKHEWMEKHCGSKIECGIGNGSSLIQWSCCKNIWDNNTANGCNKICKYCGVNYNKYMQNKNHKKNYKNGCIEDEEIVKYVIWSCCNLKEEMVSFNSRGCQSVYSCCKGLKSSKGCQVVNYM
eukprot:398193_1